VPRRQHRAAGKKARRRSAASRRRVLPRSARRGASAPRCDTRKCQVAAEGGDGRRGRAGFTTRRHAAHRNRAAQTLKVRHKEFGTPRRRLALAFFAASRPRSAVVPSFARLPAASRCSTTRPSLRRRISIRRSFASRVPPSWSAEYERPAIVAVAAIAHAAAASPSASVLFASFRQPAFMFVRQ